MHPKRETSCKEPFANSLCRDAGHDWRTTTSDEYRVCQRMKCKAMQRLVNGTWTTVSVERPWNDPLIAYEKKQAQPQQTALFSM